MENKLITAVTILDLSATFDIVNHDILLKILHNKFGIDGNALKWYSNYLNLNPRKFKVNIYKAYSTEKIIQLNTPQESVQEAFLFIAYTSTFPGVSSLSDVHSLRKAFNPCHTRDEDNTIATINKTMLEVLYN